MHDRHAQRVAALEARVLDAPAELAASIRRAAAGGVAPSGPAGEYAAKVRAHAYKVVDADIDALSAAGWSDDQIFELTVAVALGEGLRRGNAGLDALDHRTRGNRP